MGGKAFEGGSGNGVTRVDCLLLKILAGLVVQSIVLVGSEAGDEQDKSLWWWGESSSPLYK